jgi:hypothetical protein
MHPNAYQGSKWEVRAEDIYDQRSLLRNYVSL